MWKRKLRHFKDLFRFKDPQDEIPSMPTDSTKKEKKKE